jgi:ankyrin repeat protein
LTISNLAVRQLVYACDYNGHNPLHVLLSEGDNPSNLADQLGALVAAGFGSNLPIHYALKVGALERTLRCLVEAAPTALLDMDGERRTPLHVAFDSPRMPYFGIVQALLTNPGVNASQLKDSRGKLPIHVAAERGAGEALLRVLVDAYADGCYRLTGKGTE